MRKTLLVAAVLIGLVPCLMAVTGIKVTDLTELFNPVDEDYFPIVDVSDRTMSRNGTTKKIKFSTLATELNAQHPPEELAEDPTDCPEGQFAIAIDKKGNLTCAAGGGGGGGGGGLTGYDTVVFDAGAMVGDGGLCHLPQSQEIGSGLRVYSITCADSSSASIFGRVLMPDGWDGGAVNFSMAIIDQNETPGGYVVGAIACACVNSGDSTQSIFGTGTSITHNLTSGIAQFDLVLASTSSAVTCSGTCSGGSELFWRYQVNEVGTTENMENVLFLQAKMEFNRTADDE